MTRLGWLAALLLIGTSCGIGKRWSNSGRFVSAGGEYRNDTRRTQYLVFRLEPEKIYRNTAPDSTGGTFEVLRTQKDLFEFHKQLEIDFAIREASARLSTLADTADSLDQNLNAMKKTHGARSRTPGK